jgi:hypothetical protein
MFSRWLCLATKADVLTHDVKPLPDVVLPDVALPDDVPSEFSPPLLRYPLDYKEAMEALSVFEMEDWSELKAKLSSKDADEAVLYVRAFTKTNKVDAYIALNLYISGPPPEPEPVGTSLDGPKKKKEKPPRKGKYRGNEELLEYVREPDLYQPELDCDQSIEYLFRNGKYYDIITLDLVAWTKSTGEIVRI